MKNRRKRERRKRKALGEYHIKPSKSTKSSEEQEGVNRWSSFCLSSSRGRFVG